MQNELAGIIDCIETVRWAQQPNILWVRMGTSQGLWGCGETYYLPRAVEEVIHEMMAPMLLGRSAGNIESHWNALFSSANFYGYAGAEMRALSAVDMALWDLAGKALGVPVWALLGGTSRASIPVYNTCVSAGRYRDADAFLGQPGQLARDLLAQGIRAMKVWPWDQFSPQLAPPSTPGPAGHSAHGPVGHYLTGAQLEQGLRIVEEIREAVGLEMEILIEGHGRWDLNTGIRIVHELEPFKPLWVEDIIQPNTPGDLAQLAQATQVPQAVSERLISRFPYREVMERRAVRVVMVDVGWTGGISEAWKIATLANAFQLPISPHDCTGPIVQFANLQLCAAADNAMLLETVRGFYDQGWYSIPLTQPFIVQHGQAPIPYEPGIGTALRDDFLQRADVAIRRVRHGVDVNS